MENQHKNYRLAVSSGAKDEGSFLAPMITLFPVGEINGLVGWTSRSGCTCFLIVRKSGRAPARPSDVSALQGR